MPVDAIGGVLGSGSESIANTTLNQEDFIRLFLTELNFQDPLEPVDNKDFLAQMAQFASIEQSRLAAESTENLLQLAAVDQSVGLLGREVQAMTETGVISGSVTAIDFGSEGASLTLELQNGSFITGVKLSQINLIQP